MKDFSVERIKSILSLLDQVTPVKMFLELTSNHLLEYFRHSKILIDVFHKIVRMVKNSMHSMVVVKRCYVSQVLMSHCLANVSVR